MTRQTCVFNLNSHSSITPDSILVKPSINPLPQWPSIEYQYAKLTPCLVTHGPALPYWQCLFSKQTSCTSIDPSAHWNPILVHLYTSRHKFPTHNINLFSAPPPLCVCSPSLQCPKNKAGFAICNCHRLQWLEFQLPGLVACSNRPRTKQTTPRGGRVCQARSLGRPLQHGDAIVL